MADGVVGKLLQLVRGPVAEIERAGGTEFKRIAGRGDVIHVQFGTTMDETLHRIRVKFAQPFGVPLDGFEEMRVADQGDFDGFDVAGPFVARQK